MSRNYKVQTRFLFHTNIKIKIPEEYYSETVFDELYGILEDVNEKYNSYSENSFIDRINKNSGNFVEVNEEMIEILERVVHFSDMMNGEYDITIMPLIKLWGFYKKSDIRIPEKKEIEETGKLIDYKKIVIDRERKRGIDDTIVNAGGSSIVAVNKLEEDAWIVGVENPEKEKISEKSIEGYVTQILLDSYKEKNDEDLFDIKISDESYSTSNQGNTFVEIDNQKYGHILSPKTGYPGKNKQIGIVTKEAFTGDIISTGLYNQTPEKFFEILAKLNREIKVEGYMIDENGKIHYSEGFLKYVINE